MDTPSLSVQVARYIALIASRPLGEAVAARVAFAVSAAGIATAVAPPDAHRADDTIDRSSFESSTLRLCSLVLSHAPSDEVQAEVEDAFTDAGRLVLGQRFSIAKGSQRPSSGAAPAPRAETPRPRPAALLRVVKGGAGHG